MAEKYLTLPLKVNDIVASSGHTSHSKKKRSQRTRLRIKEVKGKEQVPNDRIIFPSSGVASLSPIATKKINATKVALAALELTPFYTELYNSDSYGHPVFLTLLSSQPKIQSISSQAMTKKHDPLFLEGTI